MQNIPFPATIKSSYNYIYSVGHWYRHVLKMLLPDLNFEITTKYLYTLTDNNNRYT